MWVSWRQVCAEGRSAFFWAFGCFLDETGKPSMSRIMLALWTYVGWSLLRHEMRLTPGQPPLGNVVFQCWWDTEGVLTVAVFGPRVAAYFGTGVAGNLSGALRDDLSKITDMLQREKKPHEDRPSP